MFRKLADYPNYGITTNGEIINIQTKKKIAVNISRKSARVCLTNMRGERVNIRISDLALTLQKIKEPQPILIQQKAKVKKQIITLLDEESYLEVNEFDII